MANLSDLNTIVTDLFGVLSTIVSGIVDLITGDLLVLAIVGAFVAMIIGIIYTVLNYVKKTTNTSVKMK